MRFALLKSVHWIISSNRLMDERFETALWRARESIARRHDIDVGRRLAAVVSEMSRGRKPPISSNQVQSHGRTLRRTGAVRQDFGGRLGRGNWRLRNAPHRKKTLLLRETMTEMEERLAPDGFTRIHRSTIVNLERIAEMRVLDNGEYRVLLRDTTELKLTRNYRHALGRLVVANDGRCRFPRKLAIS
jgi:hypothetical protein